MHAARLALGRHSKKSSTTAAYYHRHHRTSPSKSQSSAVVGSPPGPSDAANETAPGGGGGGGWRGGRSGAAAAAGGGRVTTRISPPAGRSSFRLLGRRVARDCDRGGGGSTTTTTTTTTPPRPSSSSSSSSVRRSDDAPPPSAGGGVPPRRRPRVDRGGIDDIDRLSPRDAVASWREMSLSSSSSSGGGGASSPSTTNRRHEGGRSKKANGAGSDDGDVDVRRRLEDLLRRTVENLDAYDPGQIRNVAQHAATVVVEMRSGCPPRPDVVRLFWDGILRRVTSDVDSYRPKWLVSVAWAFATMTMSSSSSGSSSGDRNRRRVFAPGGKDVRDDDDAGDGTPAMADASPLFRAIRTTFVGRRVEFTSKHMGNLAWSCATCRCADDDAIPLMRDFSNEFVRRRGEERRPRGAGSSSGEVVSIVGCNDKSDVDSLDPMTLCQWAISYAKAGHKDEELFLAISAAAIPMLGRFNSRHFSNLLYAFALAGHTPTKGGCGLSSPTSSLFDEIAASIIHQIPTFSSQHMANTLWAYAKVNHASPELFDAIAREAIPRMREFSAQQLANVAWAFSKFHPPTTSDSVFDRVAEEVVVRGFDSFTMQGLAMLAHSYASVGHVKRGDFWDAIDRAATTRRTELGAIESSQIAWSFATIGRPSDDLFRGIEVFVLSNANRIKPQGLSNLAWAFAMLGYDSPEFFRAIAEESLRRLDEFTPEDEVMLVLAYSRTSHTSPELLDRIASNSLSHLDEYTGLDLFNLVLSYVRMGRQSRHWMEVIASEIIRRPFAFSPQVIVGVTWAYASTGCRIPALLNFLSDECINSCDELKSKEVASLAWSFASLDFHHRPLLSALADSSDRRWSQFDASSIANMAWAYATGREDRPRLFEGIVNAAIDRRNEFTSQGVSMLLWSCSAAGHFDRRLFLSMEPTARSLLRECDCQSLANIAWAYAVADLEADSLFGLESPFVNVLLEKYDEFDHRGLCQLHQWNLWIKENANDSALPAHIEKRCYDEFINQPLHGSIFQKDVMSELGLMGILLEEEVRTQSGYSLDAVVHVNGESIGLEVDGPYHFVGKRPTGSTILKHRQVAAIDGIQVVSIPYWEWNDLDQSVDKQQYLRVKLGLDGQKMASICT